MHDSRVAWVSLEGVSHAAQLCTPVDGDVRPAYQYGLLTLIDVLVDVHELFVSVELLKELLYLGNQLLMHILWRHLALGGGHQIDGRPFVNALLEVPLPSDGFGLYLSGDLIHVRSPARILVLCLVIGLADLVGEQGHVRRILGQLREAPHSLFVFVLSCERGKVYLDVRHPYEVIDLFFIALAEHLCYLLHDPRVQVIMDYFKLFLLPASVRLSVEKVFLRLVGCYRIVLLIHEALVVTRSRLVLLLAFPTFLSVKGVTIEML